MRLLGTTAALALLLGCRTQVVVTIQDAGALPPDSAPIVQPDRGPDLDLDLPTDGARDHGPSSARWAITVPFTASCTGYKPGYPPIHAVATAIAVDPAGQSSLTGWFGESALGIGPAAFVARLTPDGQHVGLACAGGASNWGRGIALDSAGNTLIAGEIDGYGEFGQIWLNAAGGTDAFVARLDGKGDFVWALDAGGPKDDRARGVAVDSAGNTYVVGDFAGMALFSPTTSLLAAGARDLLVAKLDGAGKVLWVAAAGGAQASVVGRAIAVDDDGEVRVAGDLTGTASFGGTVLGSQGEEDVVVAALDSSGTFLWAVSAGGAGRDEAADIGVDAAGGSCVAGIFSTTASFGATTLTAQGEVDLFVARLDKSGQLLWARPAGGPGIDSAGGLAVDSAGTCVVTGSFQGTASFGSLVLTSAGSADVFAAGLDPGGSFLWADRAGGAGYDSGADIGLDSAGRGYITGRFHGPASFGATTLQGGVDELFVARIDASGSF